MQDIFKQAVLDSFIVCVAGEGVADRPEPIWRGDRLTSVQLGGADIRRRACSAAGQPGFIYLMVCLGKEEKGPI